MSIKKELIGYTDLALSAYLNLCFQTVDVCKQVGNRFEFVYEKTPELDKAIEDYFNNTAQVSPSDYFNSIKSLKSRIYSSS